MSNGQIQIKIDWNAVFNTMITFVVVVGMTRILSRAMSDRPALLAQTIGERKRLRFATTPIDVDRETFAEWVESDKVRLLQAGGLYRRGRVPTLAVMDDQIYAVVPHMIGTETLRPGVKLLMARWEDIAEETLHEAEEYGILLPQVKLLAATRWPSLVIDDWRVWLRGAYADKYRTVKDLELAREREVARVEKSNPGLAQRLKGMTLLEWLEFGGAIMRKERIQRMLTATEGRVTVECPLCGEVIEVRGYDHISRTQSLKRHIVKRHSGKHGNEEYLADTLPPQLDTSSDQPKRTYRDIIHDIITKYSRSSKESIDYMFFYNERHNQEQRLRLALVLAKRNNLPEYSLLKRFATKHFPYLLVRMKEDEEMWKEQDEEKEAENEDVLLPQAILIKGGELVPSQYRDLIGWVNEPLPDYSLLTFLPAIEQAAGERKIDIVLKQLKDGVEGIQQSERFRLFLVTMSKFHDYSIGNQILIMVQKRDATHVAGFNTWKDLGRWVKAGERGIAILAPVMPPRATCPKCGAKLPKGVRFCPQCGEEVEAEEIEVSPRFFKVVYVFDISQTEGKPLPEFEIPVLTGEANEELFGRAMALAKAQGLTLSFEPRPQQDPSIKGQYFGKSIWVKPDEPKAQQLKTLLHEVVHYFSEGVFRIPRRDAETIAESAAFVVGAHFGFDTGVRSFPYVALWAQDKKVLEQNLAAIRRVASTILAELEKEAGVV